MEAEGSVKHIMALITCLFTLKDHFEDLDECSKNVAIFATDAFLQSL